MAKLWRRKSAWAVDKRAVENLRTDMQDFLKLKLQAKDHLGSYPPFSFAGLEISSRATFDPQAITKSLESQSSVLVREAPLRDNPPDQYTIPQTGQQHVQRTWHSFWKSSSFSKPFTCRGGLLALWRAWAWLHCHSSLYSTPRTPRKWQMHKTHQRCECSSCYTLFHFRVFNFFFPSA